MSRVENLDSLLQSLQALKPPGASKSKIAAITTICLDNAHSDATIAQKLYSNFKKTPPTHKLGVLFVVDSVTRQWIERAKAAGQDLKPSAPSGTYASGVQRMTELLPSLVDDAIRLAPVDQKAKIQNLVDIWDRSATFPPKMLNDFKVKLRTPSTSNVPSRTPPGSPAPQMLYSLGLRKPPSQQVPTLQAPSPAPSQSFAAPVPPMPQQAASIEPTSILQMLAGLARPAQVTPAPVVPLQALPVVAPAGPPSGMPDLSSFLSGHPQPSFLPQPSLSQAAPPPPAVTAPAPAMYQQQVYNAPMMPQAPALPSQFASLFSTAAPTPAVSAAPPPPPAQSASSYLQNALGPLMAMIPPAILNNTEQLTQVLQLFGELTKANVPQDQWGPVVAALYPQAAFTQPAAPPPTQPAWQPPATNASSAYDVRDQHGRDRKRSRSPDRRNEVGQHGYVGAEYRSQTDDRYRQRSPPTSRRQNGQHSNDQKTGEKWLSYDPTLPPNHIKVLSRTLFVGGCSASDSELHGIFSQFGPVQSCITNGDKRHAFVKMCTRTGSVAAKQGMEHLSAHDSSVMAKARQTKWGVGFGPRECCDYATGESIVPIASLTEADHKWALTAEYGGTGGKDITPGMVMEEPDIEIGAGVSSKAMSRRVGPTGDQGGRGKQNGGKGGAGGGGGGGHRAAGGRHGGRSGGAQGHGHGGRQHQQQARRETPKVPVVQEQSTFQPPPPVPNFGFSFPVPGR